MLSEDSEDEDDIGWRWDSNREFSIRSAYEAITTSESPTGQFDWHRIWKLKVPMRICMFLWLVKHGREMTNVEKPKRGLTSNAMCTFCAGKDEDNNHLFWNCGETRPL